MSTEQKVRDHFHADAHRFDAIYEDEKGPITRWVDNVWRGVVRRRFELALKELEPLAGKSILDVGCGSGRYCIAYARKGAKRVIGIDFADAMITLAREHAHRFGVEDRCEFHVGRFPEAAPSGPFDACVAMGFFDYTDDPVRLISHMRRLAKSKLILSFPKSLEWRAPVRRVRFRLIGCPLFLYSESRVIKILADAGVTDYKWINLDRDYIVVANL